MNMSARLKKGRVINGQWLQNQRWIFKFESFFDHLLYNVTVTHEENAAGFVETLVNSNTKGKTKT